MAIDCIPIGADGFYHPSTEEEIVSLVKKAHDERLEVRVRGATHSQAHAIYTDPGDNDPPIPNKVSAQRPPSGPHLNIMLDRYRGLKWIDEQQGIVEADAGIHLGADPLDPTETATLEASLLHQAFSKGWTLRDLGGITHQTLGGFLSTGSSGGSVIHTVEENLQAFRVIDGTGDARWVTRDGEPDLFNALGVSMGLLGIISKVRLKLTPTFNIYGQEVTTPTELDECPLDLFGSGQDPKPSLKKFLEDTPYTRLLWWPQKGSERVVIWQATPAEPTPDFIPAPYQQFSEEPEPEELAAAIFLTVVGNLDDLSQVPKKLKKDFARFEEGVDLLLEKCGLGDPASDLLAELITGAAEDITDVLIKLLGPVLRAKLPDVFPKVVELFQPLSEDGKPTLFQDYAWRSLPMDNGADDILLGTEFTEIWVPLSRTEQVMKLFKEHFDEGGFEATGYYTTELYAANASSFWLSPSYGEPVFRVDLFWYKGNAGDPAVRDGFYAQFWELLRQKGIPFRLHWGKFLPEYGDGDWAAYLRNQYPKWDDFMALRAQRDPRNIFLTQYWRRHLAVGE